MKKWLIGLVILVILALAGWQIYRYTIGMDVKPFDKSKTEKEYASLSEADGKTSDAMADAGMSVVGLGQDYFKLKNGNYVIHQLLDGQRRHTTYVTNSYIQVDETGKSKLTIGEPFLTPIMNKEKFKTQTWTEKTPIGEITFRSGDLNNGVNLNDIRMVNDDNTQGLRVERSLNPSLIHIDSNGHWLDASNFAVGAKEKMKSYDSVEQAASATDRVEDKGELLDVLKSDAASYYIYKHQYADFNEYTILPVIKKGNAYMAGKYHRFTFLNDQNETDMLIDSQFEDSLEGHGYTILFNREAEKPLKEKLQIKDDKTTIAIRELK
ncbi:hypothetical protein ERX37_08950 [Macrococcus hajekii]|uniref:Uncharacterized protein n=1 Tax=Macrococcus hajekii TaxID=198482 RepID=A0A4R6BJB8_9STAP|nr:hypothetical protein [Macrococcus hajekii]TDM01611.1 hypothetical protein ERX37_08950 [Macrococcus hajekii]GGB01474.1 hypothetical protein GCM10007190_06940 [Macrococcus hajekii]